MLVFVWPVQNSSLRSLIDGIWTYWGADTLMCLISIKKNLKNHQQQQKRDILTRRGQTAQTEAVVYALTDISSGHR